MDSYLILLDSELHGLSTSPPVQVFLWLPTISSSHSPTSCRPTRAENRTANYLGKRGHTPRAHEEVEGDLDPLSTEGISSYPQEWARLPFRGQAWAVSRLRSHPQLFNTNVSWIKISWPHCFLPKKLFDCEHICLSPLVQSLKSSSEGFQPPQISLDNKLSCHCHNSKVAQASCRHGRSGLVCLWFCVDPPPRKLPSHSNPLL